MILAEKQIKQAFEQFQKEVNDLRKRPLQSMASARLCGS